MPKERFGPYPQFLGGNFQALEKVLYEKSIFVYLGSCLIGYAKNVIYCGGLRPHGYQFDIWKSWILRSAMQVVIHLYIHDRAPIKTMNTKAQGTHAEDMEASRVGPSKILPCASLHLAGPDLYPV